MTNQSEITTTGECCHCGKMSTELQDDYCPDCFYDYHVYCSVCDQWHYEDNLCRHIFWDNRLGYWEGPGSDDGGGEACKTSFLELLRVTGHASTIRSALETGKYELDLRLAIVGLGPTFLWFTANGEYFGNLLGSILDDDELEEKCALGLEWFYALEPGVTTEAIQRTIGWIDEYEAQKASPTKEAK